MNVDPREQMTYPDVVIYTHNCLLLLWSPFHVIHNYIATDSNDYIATVLSVLQFKSNLTKPGRGVPAFLGLKSYWPSTSYFWCVLC